VRLLSIISFCLLTSCTNKAILPMPNPSTSNFPIWAVKLLDVSDGVELYEAKLIAKAYFVSGVSTCGHPGEPEKRDGQWAFPTYISKIRVPEKDIFVDVQTGDIEWNGQNFSFESIRKLEYVR